MSDALHRILGIKVYLGLYHLEFPDRKGLDMAGCGAHHQCTTEAAEEAVTLVKDTQKILPVDPERRKRVKLYYVENESASILDGTGTSKHIVVKELEKAGFEVTLHENSYEMERSHSPLRNKGLIQACESMEELRTWYDLIIIFIHIEGYTQENTMRIRWLAGHSNKISWYSADVPTVCVSLDYTSRLYKLPTFRTFINAYCPIREYIHAVVMKITEKSEFKGHYNDTVWCERWDTRL